MRFEIMQPGQEDLAVDLVSRTFDTFVAPEFSRDGVEEFYRFANAGALAERCQDNCFVIFAYESKAPVGLIEIRDRSHIAMFFVKEVFQRRGIGRGLLQEAIRVLTESPEVPEEITVNSSPNSVSAYATMGFQARESEQCVNGIRFVPMALKIKSNAVQ